MKRQLIILTLVGTLAFVLLTVRSANPADGFLGERREFELEGKFGEPSLEWKLEQYHHMLNDLVCWNRHGKNAGSEQAKLSATIIRDFVKTVLPGVSTTVSQKDLLLLQALMASYAEGTVDAGIWAHRVLHDLDYTINGGGKGKKYYSATFTFEGEDSRAWEYAQTDDNISAEKVFNMVPAYAKGPANMPSY